MSAMVIDTHEFIKQMTAAGLTERQAEVIARHQESVGAQLVTVQHLDLRIEILRKDLMLKLGAMIVGAAVATIGIILAMLPIVLNLQLN